MFLLSQICRLSRGCRCLLRRPLRCFRHRVRYHAALLSHIHTSGPGGTACLIIFVYRKMLFCINLYFHFQAISLIASLIYPSLLESRGDKPYSCFPSLSDLDTPDGEAQDFLFQFRLLTPLLYTSYIFYSPQTLYGLLRPQTPVCRP